MALIARHEASLILKAVADFSMKLRTLIFVALVAVSVLPVGLLALWQHKTANDNQFSVVENQHKLIARNLTIAQER